MLRGLNFITRNKEIKLSFFDFLFLYLAEIGDKEELSKLLQKFINLRKIYLTSYNNSSGCIFESKV